PLVGVHLMFSTDGEERVYHCRSLCSFMAAGEEPVLATEGDGSDSILHEVVVYLQASIVQICRKRIPSGIGICHGFTDLTLWQGVLYFFKDPFAHIVDDIQRVF